KLARVISLLRERLPQRIIRFMIYTNGELINEAIKVSPILGAPIWLYSVSIDGGLEQHNRIRRGTDLRRIRENLRALRRSHKGEVLMWSTLREEQSLKDCFDEFTRLHDEGVVDHFFWHWVEKEQPMADLGAFADRYECDLRQIMETYLARLRY